MKVTSPSDLNTRITLQCQTRVSDGMGGTVVVWTDMATVWAKKTTHRSDEAVQAMATTGTAIHNFRVRYRTDVRSSWRIKEGNKLMAIIGPPIEVERRAWMDITAKETA
ncbi:MAG TPA: phage head closure protein [Dissulfurispiraceae bacterium]|nr:phage head closure protein [Dissulfurispiraceae bacterium]